MSYYSETKRNFAIVAIALILIGVLLCGIITEGFREWNPYCWFGHEYGEDGICAKCGAEKPVEEPPAEEPDEDGGLQVDPDVQARGMRLSGVKIPRPQFAEEGINPLAESAQQLTAVVTPADAIEQEVDWTVAWKNANSTFAKGKNVTDYVTVTPTADGALTANVACLQAFAEQIVVTVRVRENTGIYATATVDYEKRLLGFDFAISNSALNWSMTTSNLNPEVAFPMMHSTSETSFSEDWGYWYGDASKNTITLNVHYSIYTVDKDYSSLTISVAPTTQYINALKAAGFTVNATAGQYKQLWSDEYSATPSFSYEDLFYSKIASGSLDTYNEYVAMRSSLRQNISSAMLQLKIEVDGDERDAVTIYNLKFTAESVSPVVEDIVLNPGSIKF